MRVLVALLAGAVLLTGCGEGAADDGAAQPPSSSAATPSSSAPTSASPTSDAGSTLAVRICTEGLAEPDALVLDAMEAARAGTRSVSEIADAFREAQDLTEGLAEEAAEADLPRLSQALQDYANVLGQARVSGDAGLTEMIDTREAINVACYMPDAEASPTS
jgi:hypothetical protein